MQLKCLLWMVQRLKETLGSVGAARLETRKILLQPLVVVSPNLTPPAESAFFVNTRRRVPRHLSQRKPEESSIKQWQAPTLIADQHPSAPRTPSTASTSPNPESVLAKSSREMKPISN